MSPSNIASPEETGIPDVMQSVLDPTYVKQIALDFGDTMEKNIRNNLEQHLRMRPREGTWRRSVS